MEEKHVRYFMIKSRNLESIQRAFDMGVWSVPLKNDPQPHQLLNTAFHVGTIIV